MHARGFEASAGLGTAAGRRVGGGEWVKKTPRTTYTLGSENVPFNLPTDIFDNDHYLTALGAGARTKAGQTSIFAFLGAASTTFNTPFFEGARAGSVGRKPQRCSQPGNQSRRRPASTRRNLHGCTHPAGTGILKRTRLVGQGW